VACEYGAEPSGYIKYCEYFKWLSNCWLLKDSGFVVRYNKIGKNEELSDSLSLSHKMLIIAQVAKQASAIYGNHK
jgi:hypothetical protein